MTKLITTAEELSNLITALSNESAIGIDTESNGFFAYPEHVCLIQVSTSSQNWIIDTLAIEEMDDFGALLAEKSVQKIIHASDNDIRVIDREWNFTFDSIFDTSLAARFCGYQRTGLGSVLEKSIGVVLKKSKKLQRADWGIRPLSKEALDYAVDDVAYLIQLRDRLIEILSELDRNSWIEEEFERLKRIRYIAPPQPDVAFRLMKGSAGLEYQELLILKSIYMFRDIEARNRNVPPFKVLSNEILLYLSRNPHVDFEKVPGWPRRLSEKFKEKLSYSIKTGFNGEIIANTEFNPAKNKPPEHGKRYGVLLRALKDWRSDQGEKLNLDPSLIWPTNSLIQLAQSRESVESVIMDSDMVRNWQKQQFSDSIRAKIKEIG